MTMKASREDRPSGASEGARRATGEAPEGPKPNRGRFSARRKAETVLRLLRGEDLETLSRTLGVTAARLSEWREAFLALGTACWAAMTPRASYPRPSPEARACEGRDAV